jgi:hypothetical protein
MISDFKKKLLSQDEKQHDHSGHVDQKRPVKLNQSGI